MNIIIKNVTSEPFNDWLIFELSRAGFPAGTKVYGVKYSPKNNSCQWSCGGYDCVAWLGDTCEEIPAK